SHDLPLVSLLAHHVAVMYMGQIVETGPVETIFAQPAHPYTRALLSATPRDTPEQTKRRITLRGETPSPVDPPATCRLVPRCPYVVEFGAPLQHRDDVRTILGRLPEEQGLQPLHQAEDPLPRGRAVSSASRPLPPHAQSTSRAEPRRMSVPGHCWSTGSSEGSAIRSSSSSTVASTMASTGWRTVVRA